jgi:hypothetical protein
MSYRTRLVEHLTSYRENQLGIADSGVFRYRDRNVPRGHVLPITEKWRNLLPFGEAAIRKYLDQHPTIKLHRYFHHLTSSQAFALNLFVPFFEGGPDSSRALIRAFGQSGQIMEWKPEAVPSADEGTNLDAWWRLENRLETFCEVKLCEGEFGKCEADNKHREKLNSIYNPRLRGVVSDQLLTEDTFFANYQILRNLWHLVGSTNAELIFLLPKSNARLWKQLGTALKSVVQDVNKRVRVVATDTLLESLINDERCPAEYREYAMQLQEKYAPAALSD